MKLAERLGAALFLILCVDLVLAMLDVPLVH
jgi:hypothetical protein